MTYRIGEEVMLSYPISFKASKLVQHVMDKGYRDGAIVTVVTVFGGETTQYDKDTVYMVKLNELPAIYMGQKYLRSLENVLVKPRRVRVRKK